jgi:hypothetical protein
MRKVSLLVVLFPCLAFGAGWAGPNHNGQNATGASGSSRAVSITATTGTLIAVDVVCANTAGTAPTVSTISDGTNSYQPLVSFNDTSQHADIETWVAISAATGITTVTITMSASCTSFLDGYARDFTVPSSSTIAIDPETACGATVTGNGCTNFNGGSASASAGTITLAGTNDLVLPLAITPNSTAVNNSYVLDNNADGNCVAHLSNFGGGATSTACTTSSGAWRAIIGAVKATPSGGSAFVPQIGGFSVGP